MTIWPAIVTVAERGDVDVFAATESDTEPGPDTEPFRTVTQFTGLELFQTQPELASTLTEPEPPDAAKDNFEVLVTKLHAPVNVNWFD